MNKENEIRNLFPKPMTPAEARELIYNRAHEERFFGIPAWIYQKIRRHFRGLWKFTIRHRIGWKLIEVSTQGCSQWADGTGATWTSFPALNLNPPVEWK